MVSMRQNKIAFLIAENFQVPQGTTVHKRQIGFADVSLADTMQGTPHPFHCGGFEEMHTAFFINSGCKLTAYLAVLGRCTERKI